MHYSSSYAQTWRSGSKLYIDEADPALRPRYRTECWLEACLSRERICSLEEHPTFSPLSHTIHLPSITLSPSGLDLAEDMWVKRLARALGNGFLFLAFQNHVLTTRSGRYDARADIQSRGDALIVSDRDRREVC